MLTITLKDVLKALILKDETTIRSIRDMPTGTIYLRLAEIVKPFLDIFGRGYENLHSAPLPYTLYSCCHIYFMIDGVPMWFEARHSKKDNEIVWTIEYVIESNGTEPSSPAKKYLPHHHSPLTPKNVYKVVMLRELLNELPVDFLRDHPVLKQIATNASYEFEQWTDIQEELNDYIVDDSPLSAKIFTLLDYINETRGLADIDQYRPFQCPSVITPEDKLFDRREKRKQADDVLDSIWNIFAINANHALRDNEDKHMFFALMAPLCECLLEDFDFVSNTADLDRCLSRDIHRELSCEFIRKIAIMICMKREKMIDLFLRCHDKIPKALSMDALQYASLDSFTPHVLYAFVQRLFDLVCCSTLPHRSIQDKEKFRNALHLYAYGFIFKRVRVRLKRVQPDRDILFDRLLDPEDIEMPSDTESCPEDTAEITPDEDITPEVCDVALPEEEKPVDVKVDKPRRVLVKKKKRTEDESKGVTKDSDETDNVVKGKILDGAD